MSFVSVTQQFNSATSMGRLILNVLLSFAQFEREMISERTRDKIAMARKRGKYAGGWPILGYDVVDTKLIVNELEADQVRQIFELYLEHKSLIRTATDLNRRGWTSKRWISRKGKPQGGRKFDKGSLHQLLTNVTYIGKIRHKTQVYAGEHTGIVDQKLWDRVQRQLRANGQNAGADVRCDSAAILNGILWCAACNRKMSHSYSSRGTKRYRYYVCGRAQKEGWKACPKPSIPAPKLEQFVADKLAAIVKDPLLITETVAAYREQVEERLSQQLDLRKRLQADLGRYHGELAGVLAERDLDQGRLAELQEHIRLVEEKLAGMGDLPESAPEVDAREIAAKLTNFDTVWSAMNGAERRELIGAVVERVEFDAERGSVRLAFHDLGIRALSEVAA